MNSAITLYMAFLYAQYSGVATFSTHDSAHPCCTYRYAGNMSTRRRAILVHSGRAHESVAAQSMFSKAAPRNILGIATGTSSWL